MSLKPIGFDLSNNPVYASIKDRHKDYLIGELQFDPELAMVFCQMVERLDKI